MGYCYTMDGKLCCDVCDEAPARKYPCPFGYCQAVALCPKCKKERPHLTSREGHRKEGCEEYHRRFVAEQAARQALLEAGGWLRVSARTNDEEPPRVEVIFRNGAGATVCFVMSRAAYRAIPYGVPACPADYQRVAGELGEAIEPMGKTFSNGRTGKQVSFEEMLGG